MEIYVKTNGIFKVGESGTGTINVDHIQIKNNATCYIYTDGTVTTETYVDNNQTITVDGELIIGTFFNNDGIVTGSGTISASSYTGTGTTFGIANNTISGTVSGYTWDGDTDSDWNTGANWSQGLIPSSSTHNVFIPSGVSNPYPIIATSGIDVKNISIESGATLEINPTYSLTVNGDLSNSGTLTIKSTASGTASLLVNGTSTGNVVVERYLTDGEWHLVAPSTSGVTANDFFWNFSPSAWLAYHSESTNGWTYNTPLETSMPVGQGWSIWLDNATKAAVTATMTGTIQVSDFTASLEYTGSSDDQGWNLLGNPFTTAIDWDNISTQNTTGTVYVWDNDYNGSGDYRTWNGSTGDLTNGIIPLGQGFFVKSTAAGDILFLQLPVLLALLTYTNMKMTI